MIFWPPEPELPERVLMEGFQYSFSDGRIRTEMSRGFARVGGSARGAPLTVPCMLMITIGQLGRLQRFWEEDTEGGALWFVIPDQMFDRTKLLDENFVPVLDENFEYVLITALWLARFSAGAPSVTPVSHEHVRVAFALDARPL